jgi:hypothetical protein
MLFFNIFAQLILFVAAWIVTANQEAVPAIEEKLRFPLTPPGERRAPRRMHPSGWHYSAWHTA